MDFHHPLFQSLALPFVLAFAATGVLRGILGPIDGRRWGAAGTAFAILAVSIWVLGLRSSPGSLTEKLPWIYAAGGLLGLGLQAVRAKTLLAWLATCVVWALVLTDLGATSLMSMAAPWLIGVAVIGAVLREPPEGATAPAMLMVASLGLAAVAMTAGSALLFELGLALGFAVAGCALWVWPIARLPFGPSGAVAAVIAWLALTQGTAVLSPVRPAVLLLLAGAFLSGPIVRWGERWLRRGRSDAATPTRAWVRPLIVAAVAAIWVAGALALALRGGTEAASGAQDDPYYTPRW
jgi:hypothetical protein